MGIRSFKLSLCVLAGAVLVLAGCASSPSVAPGSGGASAASSGSAAPATPQTPAIDNKITLALLVPQSGANQATQLGKAMANAARMGAADLRDPVVTLKVYDTAGDPATAARVAQRAIGDGADIILGPLYASATKSVAPVASGSGLKVLSFSTDVTAAGGNVWVTGFLPQMEAARVLSYATSQGYGDVGVFYPATPYGDAAMQGAREASAAGRTVIVGDMAFAPGFEGIQEAAPQFAASAAGASTVLIATGGADLNSAGAFLDFNNFDPKVIKFLGLGQWYSGSTLKELTLRGGWFPAPDPLLSSNFSNRYAAQFGTKPPLLAVLGYDAVQIAGQAVRLNSATGAGDAFSDAVMTRPGGFNGALGIVRLTPDGRSERALAILEVDSRSFRTVDPAPTSFAFGS
ncbi:MAG: penicillin-binding protein activator [Pseudomonadota bacterium]